MLTFPQVLAGLAGELRNQPSPRGETLAFPGACIDSRQVRPGELFVALRGERGDGHHYVADAFARGAGGAMVGELPPGMSPQEPGLFLVGEPLRALQRLAAYWRKKHPVTVIGVTGSVGKTTLRAFIAQLLSARGRVLSSEGSYNTEIGLPLTLLRLSPQDRYAVLEMGMYALGEIRALCQIARPRLGVVINVGPSHLERLGSLENIARAKGELVESLPRDGVAILNGDDPLARPLAQGTQATVLFFGLGADNAVRASEVRSQGLEGLEFRLWIEGTSHPLHVPLWGRHLVPSLLATAAVGWSLGMTWEEIASGLQALRSQPRLRLLPGRCDSTIIDDTYNASPASTLAALDFLSELEGRKLAVLGDMLELGSYEEEGHRLVGQRAAAVLKHLIVVGERARIIGQEAQSQGLRVDFAPSKEQAIALLRERLQPGDRVLVKGSRALAMEEIVEAIRQ